MPAFTHEIELHRFVRATDAASALIAAERGRRTHTAERISYPTATVDAMFLDDFTAERYTHPGFGDDLWEATARFTATVEAFDEFTAREAAHLLVTVDPDAAASDVFEPELEVAD